MLATAASAQVCVPLGHSSLYLVIRYNCLRWLKLLQTMHSIMEHNSIVG